MIFYFVEEAKCNKNTEVFPPAPSLHPPPSSVSLFDSQLFAALGTADSTEVHRKSSVRGFQPAGIIETHSPELAGWSDVTYCTTCPPVGDAMNIVHVVATEVHIHLWA